MARYNFDVHDGEQFVRDGEGSEFDSLDAGVLAATCSAAEIGTGRLAKGNTSDIVIEVRAEHNQRVCTVTASMRIDCHATPPQGPNPWSA